MEMSLTTPSVTFRLNESDSINHYVGIANKNPFPIKIIIDIPEDLDITFHNITIFELEPNQTRNIHYTIKANEHGNFTYFIPVQFKSENQSFSLQSKINLIVYPKKNIDIVLGITILVLLFLFVFMIAYYSFIKKR